MGFESRRPDALEANKWALAASIRWRHMFFRLLAEDAKLHQEVPKGLICPGVRRKSFHLRENAMESIWLKIPQGLRNHPHVTAGHKGVSAGVVHANMSRGGIHMQNQ